MKTAMRRASIAILLFFLFFLCGVPPFARPSGAADQTWKTITDRSGKDAILYDPTSVTRPSKDIARVWIRRTGQQRILEEFHCAYKIVREVQVVTELPGKPPQISTFPSEWRGVASESPLGELFRKLCR